MFEVFRAVWGAFHLVLGVWSLESLGVYLLG